MLFRKEESTGYMYAYQSGHPHANKNGKVLEHLHVMYLHLGRPIADDETVHHIDRDRSNNLLSNLQLMPKVTHGRLHALEVHRKLPNLLVYVDGKICDSVTGEIFEDVQPRNCPHCNKEFTPAIDRTQYCSLPCSRAHSRLFNPSKEELLAKVWTMPTTFVAKFYGVSDVAVAKRCKVLGVEKPPRGYWAIEAAKALKIQVETRVCS